jgi:transglutaminase-like putative cysteine protease
VAQWQRITIYRYTLPPPYEATEHLFEELPLSTYPSGTTMEPLAYEMAPGAHLGRAAPWTQALVLFPWCEPTRPAGARASLQGEVFEK